MVLLRGHFIWHRRRAIRIIGALSGVIPKNEKVIIKSVTAFNSSTLKICIEYVFAYLTKKLKYAGKKFVPDLFTGCKQAPKAQHV